ncbi:thiol-disulfide isomerase/thioredoxin [Lewinella aquimaris]|uniref:Thiol-disulfide isomerase/thioredoxin n=1 Tax=Neolewinella aquimaris TaxID=1835722 RepID=A0A840EEW2_9BACT|nr:thioredoxin domain-containing protein [Neolewinella aquimaris]MBB4080478.1 thiol-disulfide isomerase/thioredoxin [Neolewinella aquimaris]
MSKSLLALLFLSSLGLLAQQEGGVRFEEKPFDELLAQARQEDKLIFIDAYATWCGPCKMMTAKVFPDSAVGAVYNARFINAKFDMEKGEGPGLARRYSVSAYPTYLFVNGEGDLVHKGLGYIPKPALLNLADVAISENSLGALGDRYEAGDRDPAFVKMYAEVLTANYEEGRADRVVSGYLDGQQDWSSPENLHLILASPGNLGDKRMSYLIEHAREIEKVLGDGTAMGVIQRALVNDYHRSNRKRSLVAPAEIKDHYIQHAPLLKDQLLAQYTMMYHERLNEMEAYLPAAVAYYRDFPSDDPAELNSLAWTFYQNADDPEHLAQAISWAERSVEIRPDYPNLDTLAWLYQKTGQLEKAKAAARRAIEYAKADDLDFSETEKILN